MLTAAVSRYHASGERAVENISVHPVRNAASRTTYALTGAKLAFVAGGERTESALTAVEAHYNAGGERAVDSLCGANVRAAHGFARSAGRQS